MASPPLLRWGLTLSFAFALIALALAFRLQQGPDQYQQQQQPLSSNLRGDASHAPATTHCYRRVRTQDPGQPAAHCFSVVNGTFQRVWADNDDDNDDDVDGGESGVVSAAGGASDGYVIPGLWDGHGHLLQYGEFLHSVDLFGSQSLGDVRDRIKAYLRDNPDAGTKEQWLRGVGWDQTAFGRMPTAADIEQDDDLKGIYMMLDRIDVHCTWVSRSVLALLGPPSSIPPTVPGGEIVRDPGMGVFCDNAMDLVTRHWARPTAALQARAVRSAMRSLNSLGIVGMHDAGAPPSVLRLYADLAARADWWTVRVYGMMECEDARNTFCPDDAVRIVPGSEGDDDDNDNDDGSNDDPRLTVRSIKLFADGALGSWGSAMLEPYADHPWTSGSMLINASALTAVTKSWAAAGYQVNIHAIGDLANRNAVDAFEAALDQQCPEQASSAAPDPDDANETAADRLTRCQASHRFRIEHAQIIHPDDQRRIHTLGLIPSIQPTHATSDMKYALSRLGPSRLANSAYRMKSLLDAHPVLGSDFPVEPPDPFQGIYAATTRRSPHTGLGAGGPDDHEGWHAEEALSLDDALWGFTGGPAHGAFMDGRAGVIKKGALADWVVLDEPLENMDVESLRNVRVRETWVGGKMVYARDD